MKVWLGDREEEKGRLLSLGIHPAMIYPNGDVNLSGIPLDSTLREAGLRLPTPKEARYVNSLLETIGCYSSVWTRHSEGEWYSVIGFDDVIASSARLVLIERED
jgi:hypothetical protein